MALDTVQDYVDEARTLLQDLVNTGGVSYRYPDTQLVRYLNMACLDAYRVRPDLFLKNLTFTVPSFSASAMTTAVSIEYGFRVMFTEYMAGRAQLSDQEDTTDARAAALIKMFQTQLQIAPS